MNPKFVGGGGGHGANGSGGSTRTTCAVGLGPINAGKVAATASLTISPVDPDGAEGGGSAAVGGGCPPPFCLVVASFAAGVDGGDAASFRGRGHSFFV